jgi:hypothetical protein
MTLAGDYCYWPRGTPRFVQSSAWARYRPFTPWGRKTFREAVPLELLDEGVVSSRTRRNPRGVKRKMSGYRVRPRGVRCNILIDFEKGIKLFE